MYSTVAALKKKKENPKNNYAVITRRSQVNLNTINKSRCATGSQLCSGGDKQGFMNHWCSVGH